MSDKQKLVALIAAILIAQDFSIRRLMKQRKILIQAFTEQMENNTLLMKKTEYLFHKMEENDITFDEFDLIVLADNIPQE